MRHLSLRVDVIDRSDPLRPDRPVGFSVVGLVDGAAAAICLDVTGEVWQLHLARPGEPIQTVPMRFLNPHNALRHVERWLDDVRRQSGDGFDRSQGSGASA